MTEETPSLTCNVARVWGQLLDLGRDHLSAPDGIEECRNFEFKMSEFIRMPGHTEQLARALNGRGLECYIAILACGHANAEDLRALFRDLLPLVFSTKFSQAARNLILRMPREWVISRIAAGATPWLEKGDYLDFGMLMLLYRKLDPQLALGLAQTASRHHDSDVMEFGADYLSDNPLGN